MPGKISRLPTNVINELNRRLEANEPREPILEWLNSLPEVQASLSAHSNGKPITCQTLYDWKRYGFRTWRLRQDALEFLADLEPDHPRTTDCNAAAEHSPSPGGEGRGPLPLK